jgi:hypothetical protein
LNKPVAVSQWFQSVDGYYKRFRATRHALHPQGEIRRLEKGNVVEQVRLINQIFGIAAWSSRLGEVESAKPFPLLHISTC